METMLMEILNALNKMYGFVWAATNPNTAATLAWLGVFVVATTLTLTICKVIPTIVRGVCHIAYKI